MFHLIIYITFFFLVYGYLSCKRRLQFLTYHLVVWVSALQVHQLGDGGLHGTVMPAYHMGNLQLESSAVSFHFYTPSQALADVDDVNTTVSGLVEKSHNPRSVRGISRAVGTHHDSS